MKKLIGLLASGALCMFAACSSGDDDNSITPVASNNNGGNNSSVPTKESCEANNMVLNFDQASGQLYCAPATQSSPDMQTGLSSSSFDPYGTSQTPTTQPGITPVAQSSSSGLNIVPATNVSSSSAPAATTTTPTTTTPTTTTPTTTTPTTTTPADEDDGAFKLGLWDGTAGDVQVPTGNKAGGWWYSYADDLGSAITWKAELGAENDMAPVIEACGGVCGDFVIGAGDPDEGVYPYLGFAFGYGKTNAVADATTSKGICVTYSYSGDATFAIELGLTQTQENKLSNALPMVELPAGTKKTLDFNWSDFEQPSWATTTMTGANAAKQLSSIKFKFADVTGGESGSFTIFKVGAPGQCN